MAYSSETWLLQHGFWWMMTYYNAM